MANPQTVTLRELNGDKYTPVTNSQDVSALLDHVGLPEDWRGDITAAVVVTNDGDYAEVWLTESAKWYDLRAQYSNLDYYLA